MDTETADYGLCEGPVPAPTRRGLLGAGLALAVTAWAGASSLAQVSARRRYDGNVLVTVFLRGGMDGLSMLVPHADDDYHRQRPTLSLGKASARGVRDIDGRFGLHPSLADLLPLFKEGKMAGIHAIGSMDQSRSHFEAMAVMERGAASDPQAIPSGWLARAVDALPDDNPSPLRAVAFGSVFPDILRGAPAASLIQRLEDVKLGGSDPFQKRLAALYADGADPVRRSGRETMSVLKTLERLDPKGYRPAGGAKYPESPLGNGLRQTAILIKADVGLAAAALDRGGWDTHVTQGGAVGYLSIQLADVGASLAAFARDLGSHLDRVTVVVMTEFGRRVPENSGLGTDHGRASAWLALGGGVKGGKVHARWPGLQEDQLEGPGDLKVTTDYRDALGELLRARWPGVSPARVFPGAPGKRVGVFG